MRDRPPFVPQRVLLPPAPNDPALRRRWEQLSFDERRHLARLAASPGMVEDIDGPGAPDERSAQRSALVGALACARIRTRWRLYAAAVVLGWLVLSTVWGFGRAGFPDHAGTFLLAGVVGGVLATTGGIAGARRRVRAARGVLERLPRQL